MAPTIPAVLMLLGNLVQHLQGTSLSEGFVQLGGYSNVCLATDSLIDEHATTWLCQFFTAIFNLFCEQQTPCHVSNISGHFPPCLRSSQDDNWADGKVISS